MYVAKDLSVMSSSPQNCTWIKKVALASDVQY